MSNLRNTLLTCAALSPITRCTRTHRSPLSETRARRSILITAALLAWFSPVCAIRAQHQDVERPAEWKNLAYGGRFMDRIAPMPYLGKPVDDTWGNPEVRPRDLLNGIEDPVWSYWGGNILLGPDGLYHQFVCRWAEDHPEGHWAWPGSELVHAVSKNRLGPFKMEQVIGPGHNPEAYIAKDGRYVCYVIDAYYIADRLEGPWERRTFEFDTRDRRIVEGLSNLSFTRREDGSYLMVCRGGGIWCSKDGLGPWEQITQGSNYPKVEGRFEDPVIWRGPVQYHMIVNDWFGRIAYHLRSKNGVQWKVDSGEAYMPGVSVYEDGKKEEWYKYERPKVVLDEQQRAVQINFAVIDSPKGDDRPNDNHSSKNIGIPLIKPRLLTLLTPEITPATQEIRVRIAAEMDFNPQTDMELESLRFGAPEEVDYGKGCRLLRTEKSDNGLILIFSAEGNGFDADNFSGKLLGRTAKGDLLFGYARLPWVEYEQPILSTRKAAITRKDDAHLEAAVEVSNFGPVDSETARLEIDVLDSDNQLILKAEAPCPALKPYEKTTLNVTLNTSKLKELQEYTIRSSVIYRREVPLVYEEQRVLIEKPSVRGEAEFKLASRQHPVNNEREDKLTDGNMQTKLCFETEDKPVELTINLETPAVVTCVSMASANDVPSRDPHQWSIEGSQDGQIWKIIKEFTFDKPIQNRFQPVSVTFSNTAAYRFYRLVFQDNHGDSHFHLSELDLH
ncbi:MAG: discoidin domain-containing protein [Pontiellaceae bacterium]|nr:discoidin domain-containing protein [Pontiellaceae bacterium]